MVEALRRLLLAGLGTVDLTEEKLRAVFNDLVARGEISEKDARDVISSWTKRASEGRGRLKDDVEQAVNKTLQAMGLARRSELDALATRLAELERKVAGEPPAHPGPGSGSGADVPPPAHPGPTE